MAELQQPTMSTATNIDDVFSKIEMFPGVGPYRTVKEFAISFEGFIPLVEQQYAQIALNQPLFKENIAESAFVYYCVQHLYARCVTIKEEVGEASHWESVFAAHVLSGKFVLPLSIHEYIISIGNVIVENKFKYQLKFPAWPNEAGDFGRVGPNTHWKYMTFPCPQVVWSRLFKDFFSQGCGCIWSLENDLEPLEKDHGSPTRNMLGWAGTTWLNQSQKNFMNLNNMTKTNKQFCFNATLFEKISSEIEKTFEKIKLSKVFPSSTNGSLALTCWNEIKPYNRCDVSLFYAENNYIRVHSLVNVDAGIALASLIYSFRIRKDAFKDVASYCVYKFKSYNNVPKEWKETANTIFSFGSGELWNGKLFSSPYILKAEYYEDWLKRHAI